MTTASSSNSSLSTTASDYAESYYRSGLGPPYEESEPHWEKFFGAVAAHLVEHLAPRSALDVGCAKGFFVDALVQQGVDAYGTDISEYAVENAVGRVRDRISVHDLTLPFEGHWDIVSCIEVIEHMAPVDAQRALDNITAVTELVLFSSTPHDFLEPTHVNVHPPADWAEWFAMRGFFRRTDIDVSGLSAWATLFERRRLSAPGVVHLYETELAALREEVVSKREALLQAQRRLDEFQSPSAPEPSGETQGEPLPDLFSVERILTLTDQVLGLQAELGEVHYRYDRMAHDLATTPTQPSAAWASLEGGSDAVLKSQLETERELSRALRRRLEDEKVRADEATKRGDAALARAVAAEERVASIVASRSWRTMRLLGRTCRRLNLGS